MCAVRGSRGCRQAGCPHRHRVRIPGGNHLDRQLRLRPCDYVLGGPQRFGSTAARFAVPPGGDVRSMRLAAIQHELVLAWRANGGPSGAELARRWGFSRQTWSRTVLGQRWAGAVGLAALLEGAQPTGLLIPRAWDRPGVGDAGGGRSSFGARDDPGR